MDSQPYAQDLYINKYVSECTRIYVRTNIYLHTYIYRLLDSYMRIYVRTDIRAYVHV